MNDMPSGLRWLEAHLQALFEGSAARLFPKRGASQQLTHQLVQAMQSGVHLAPDGRVLAPNLFRLCTHPDLAYVLQYSPAFLDELTGLLRQAVLEAELDLGGPLQVRVEADARLAAGEVRVYAQDSLQDITPTHGLQLNVEQLAETPPGSAFLIVDGQEIFPLNGGVVNIGRRPDNHLVIQDARVSRLHAQLRLVRGRYMLFDLQSTSGTYVNGARVRQHILAPGDVISLAGVPLVFGNDAEERADTQELKENP